MKRSVSDYMDGFEDGAIDNQQFSFTTIEHYTNYWQTIPNNMSSFVASGNYLLTVYLQSDPDSIVFTRRFKVFEPLTIVEATVGRVQGSVGLMENQNVAVKVNPLEGNYFINPDTYMFVYAEQNGRTDGDPGFAANYHGDDQQNQRKTAENHPQKLVFLLGFF